ncbi:fasciclin-1 isoform X2 [Aethina tumida]|uniref:fasciclin-1 isoform X2 n=1 Tax=Aethina tumida TaxID=116153 RepID=UPI002148F26B|nr:fasciclin-1 isoform X2 [Aethina tumida]
MKTSAYVWGALLVLNLCLFRCGVADTVVEKISNDPDLSEFYSLLEASKQAKVTLQYKQVTIFAPTNSAFQMYGGPMDDPNSLVLYHMTSAPKRTDQLGTSSTSLYSELEGSPPVWITHRQGQYHDDIFVNNARLLYSQSNILGSQSNGNEQVLHKIDEVLVPTRSPQSASRKLFNPTALEFLENYESLIQNPHRVRIFRQKVQQNNKQDIFKTEGGHTYFIPVDEGFKNERAAFIDDKIIDGHVIPKQVLFTNPTKKDMPFQTLANGDNDIRVVISFTQEQRGHTVINYVKSHTLLGDGKHTPGVVLAEIVKPNIPVKNGVIHLIQKPLMVVDSTVKDLLEVFQARTLSRGKNLYFNVVDHGNNRTMTVEGGGVNATVIQADLAATNGIIHIIDRVLGVPCTTILDKLRTDPMLNLTYYLGNLQSFNRQLNDTNRKFTYFVPRDKAWLDARILIPSTIKKLFMHEFAYHATKILERHLIISDVNEPPYTIERIKQLTTNSTKTYGSFVSNYVELPTVRGSLKLYIEERPNSTFVINWRGEKIPIFRPNVECTNGIIHVIDVPLLQERDIKVNGATQIQFTCLLAVLFIFVLYF